MVTRGVNSSRVESGFARFARSTTISSANCYAYAIPCAAGIYSRNQNKLTQPIKTRFRLHFTLHV